MLAGHPEALIPGYVNAESWQKHAAYMLGARNLSMALLLGLALLSRQRGPLRLALIMRFATELMDFAADLATTEVGPPKAVFFLAILGLELAAIMALRNQEHPAVSPEVVR